MMTAAGGPWGLQRRGAHPTHTQLTNRIARLPRPGTSSSCCITRPNSRRLSTSCRSFTSNGNATASSAGGSSSGSSDDDEEQQGAADIWQPPPLTPALGRKRKVALMIAAACLELSLTGGLLWSPLLGALALSLLQPTRAEIARQRDAAVAQAVAQAELRLARQLPITPVEPAAWLNRLNQDMWAPFLQPFLLANNLSMWQDMLAAAAPRGWEVTISDVSIGSLAPEMSDFQAFADPDSGVLTALDCRVAFDSDSVTFAVVGKGPLGAFTARVSAVSLQGQLRITPLLQHRLLLVGFTQQPQVRVSLSLSAPLFKTALSPGDLGQLNLIQGLLGDAIRDTLVEPARIAVSLDAEMRVEEAVATTLHLSVDVISGLPRSAIGPVGSSSASLSAAAGGGGRGAAGGGGPRIALVVIDVISGVRRSTAAVSPAVLRRAALLRQALAIELPRKQGTFRLEARELPGGRGGSKGGSLLGWCMLNVAAARDGTTLFWAHDRSGAPLATRWAPSDAPWRVTLPLASDAPGSRALEVSLAASVEPWAYKQPLTSGGPRGSAGPRVVVLQVVEATSAAPATRVQLCYDQEAAATATSYGSSSPIFGEVFAFQENRGALARRVKLDVWHDGPPPPDNTTPTTTAAALSSPGAASAGGAPASAAGVSAAGAAGRAGVKGAAAGPGRSSSPGPARGSRRQLGGGALGSRDSAAHLNHHTPARSGRGRSSRDGSSSSRSASHSRGSSAPNSATSSRDVLSHQLSGIAADLEAADPESHMLVDVELEAAADEESPGQQQQQWQRQQGSGETAGSSSSSSGSGSSSVNLGSAMINLDQLTELVIQDRWFALSGADGGEVRLRLGLVPGVLGGGASSRRGSSSKRGSGGGGGGGGGGTLCDDEVAHVLSFFHKSLQGSSRESLMVEVVSARLFLPLSSLGSGDIDQPAYLLACGGSSTVSLPRHLRPIVYQRPQRQQQQRSSSSGGSSSASKASSPATRMRDGSSGSGSGSSSISSMCFEDLLPGNVSQQVSPGQCLARAVFPLPAAAMAAAASTSTGQPVRILLLDPDNLEDASPAESAALVAAAAGSGSSSGGAGQSEEVLGCVEVDAGQLLGLAGNGSSSGSAAAAAGTGSWEGWVQLNGKDGGHLLLRLTHLPASEPADLVPPPLTAALAAAGDAGSSPGGSSAAEADAAAVVAGAAGAGADDKDDGRGGSLAEQQLQLLKKTVREAEHQVGAVVSQVSDAASSWWSSSSSSINSWISSSGSLLTSPWSSKGGSSSSKAADGSKDANSSKGSDSGEAQQAAADKQQAQKQQKQGQPALAVDLAGLTKAWGWAGDEQQQTKQRQQQQQQQPNSHSIASVTTSEDSDDAGGGSSTGGGSGSSSSSRQHVPVSSIMAVLDNVIHSHSRGHGSSRQQGPVEWQQPQQATAPDGNGRGTSSSSIARSDKPSAGSAASSSSSAAAAAAPAPGPGAAPSPLSHPLTRQAIASSSSDSDDADARPSTQDDGSSSDSTGSGAAAAGGRGGSGRSGSSTRRPDGSPVSAAAGTDAAAANAAAAAAGGVLLSSHPLSFPPLPGAASSSSGGDSSGDSGSYVGYDGADVAGQRDVVWGDADSSEDEF